jgi:hypothetical protein
MGMAIPLLALRDIHGLLQGKSYLCFTIFSGLMSSDSQTGASAIVQCCYPSDQVAEVAICYGTAFQKSVEAELHVSYRSDVLSLDSVNHLTFRAVLHRRSRLCFP